MQDRLIKGVRRKIIIWITMITMVIQTIVPTTIFAAVETADPSATPITYVKAGDFVTGVSLKDKDGSSLGDDVSWDSETQIQYAFAVNWEENNVTTSAGLYFEVEIPIEIEIPLLDKPIPLNIGGDRVGDCYVLKNERKMQVVFNEKAIEYQTLTGSFGVGGKFDEKEIEKHEGGPVDIEFKIEGKSEAEVVTINFKSKEEVEKERAGTATVSKSGAYITEGSSKGNIKWTVTVEPTTDTVTGAKITDYLLGKKKDNSYNAGLTFLPSTFQVKNNAGSIAATENVDYIYDSGTQSVEYTLPTTINKADGNVIITYETSVDDTMLVDATNSFYNKVDLEVGATKMNQSDVVASVPISVNWISKKSNGITFTDPTNTIRQIEWEITVNQDSRTITDAKIEDVLKGGLTFVSGSFDTNDKDGTLEVKDGKLTYTFGEKPLKTKKTIKFRTSIPIDKNNMPLENEAELIGEGLKVSSNRVGIEVGTSTIVKDGTYNPADHTITWTIKVNDSGYTIPKEAEVTDTIPAGLTYVTGSMDLNSAPAFSWDNNETEMKWTASGDFNTTQIITYKTTVDSKEVYGNNQSDESFINTAKLNSLLTGDATSTKSVPTPSEVINKVNKGFNYATKEFTWEVVVNQNKMPITEAFFIDKLGDNQEYVANSLILPTGITATPEYITESGKVIGFKLDLGSSISGNQYTIQYKTRISNDQIFLTSGNKSFINTAYLIGNEIAEKDTESSTGKKGVLDKETKEFPYEAIKKNFKYNQGDDYVLWDVVINPLNAPMGQVDIEDKLAPGLRLDLNSITLYKLVISSNGIITKGAVVSTADEASISYNPANYNTDNNIFTYTVPAATTNEGYILEFGTEIVDTSIKSIKNEVSFVGVGNGGVSGSSSQPTQVAVKVDTANANINGVRGGAYKITKLDATNPNIKLSGAEFTCYYQWKGEWVEKGKAISDSQGVAVFRNLTKGKQYKIEETKAPDRYKRTIDPIYVTIGVTEDIKEQTWANEKLPTVGSAVLIKKDATSYASIEDVEFELYQSLDNGVTYTSKKDTYETNSQGIISVSSLPFGKYMWKETKTALGYEMDAQTYVGKEVDDQTVEPLIFEITATQSEKEITAYNSRKLGIILLHKTSEGIDFQGVTFKLYKDNNLYQTTEHTEGKYITNEKGEIKVSNLPWGDYYFIEETPLGYVEINKKYNFSVNQNTVGSEQSISVSNSKKLGKVELTKTDKDNNDKPLANVTFALYKDDVLIDDNYKTDQNGKINVENLAWGNYYFKEIKVPVGYTLDTNTKLEFIINAATVSETQYVSMGNTRYLGNVELLKSDVQTSEALSNVTFKLYKDDVYYGTYTTSADGKITAQNLPWGAYYFIETQPRVGYKANLDKISFIIDADRVPTLIKLIVSNEKLKGQVELVKTSNTGKALAGVEFGFYKEDGTLMTTELTDANGNIKIVDLEWGSYYFQELKALSGYKLDTSKLKITIDENNVADTEQIKFVNKRKDDGGSGNNPPPEEEPTPTPTPTPTPIPTPIPSQEPKGDDNNEKDKSQVPGEDQSKPVTDKKNALDQGVSPDTNSGSNNKGNKNEISNNGVLEINKKEEQDKNLLEGTDQLNQLPKTGNNVGVKSATLIGLLLMAIGWIIRLLKKKSISK